MMEAAAEGVPGGGEVLGDVGDRFGAVRGDGVEEGVEFCRLDSASEEEAQKGAAGVGEAEGRVGGECGDGAFDLSRCLPGVRGRGCRGGGLRLMVLLLLILLESAFDVVGGADGDAGGGGYVA